MNLSEIRTSTLVWLNDLNAGYYANDQVNRWINNAMWAVYRRMVMKGQNFNIKCVQTSLVAKQRTYPLPDDFKNLNRLEVITSGAPPQETAYQLLPVTLNQTDLLSITPGDPKWYLILKNSLRIYPAPVTAYTLRLFYTPLIVDLVNDTDVPDVIPRDYHELISLYATRDGFIKDERTIPEILMAKITELESDIDDDSSERQEDQPRQIVETGDSATAGFQW